MVARRTRRRAQPFVHVPCTSRTEASAARQRWPCRNAFAVCSRESRESPTAVASRSHVSSAATTSARTEFHCCLIRNCGAEVRDPLPLSEVEISELGRDTSTTQPSRRLRARTRGSAASRRSWNLRPMGSSRPIAPNSFSSPSTCSTFASAPKVTLGDPFSRALKVGRDIPARSATSAATR